MTNIDYLLSFIESRFFLKAMKIESEIFGGMEEN
jgi:hypothetical protein